MKKFICTILALVMALSLVACGGNKTDTPAGSGETAGSESSDGPTYTFKISHCLATTSGYQAFCEKFKEIVETETNGDIVLEIYPAAQLGGERESNEAAQLGTLDFSYTAVGPLANFIDGLEVYNLPFLFEDTEHAHAYFDGEEAAAKLASFEQSGFVGLCWTEIGFYDLFLNKPVQSVADMQGLTIRCQENTLYMAYLSAMGANPVPMAWSEVPAAITNGTIDGTMLGIPGSYDLQMFKDNFYSAGDINWGATPFVMSKIVYDQLPAEYQELMHTAAQEALTYQREWYAEKVVEFRQDMLDGGTTFYDIERDAWIEHCVDTVYKDMLATGLVDAEDINIINSYRKTDPIFVP